MRNKLLFPALGILIIGALTLGALLSPGRQAGVQAQTTPTADKPLRTISVNGSSKVSLPPDLAIINIGVHTENANAAEAVAANTGDTQKVMTALTAAGIAARDMQTANFSIYPRQDYDNQGKITGITYVVDNSVTVKVRDLESIGSLLDDVVTAGANSINGIQFTVENPQAAYNQGLDAAVKDARSRAEALATAAGVELGEVQSISSYLSGGPEPIYRGFAADMAVAEAAAVPISPGQTEIQVEVSVVWLIQE